MLDRILAFAERHGMFSPGCRLGVAVSGGADSVCLLHVLRELAPHWNLRLEVLHLDHGLRGAESAADAAFVERLATDFALPFHLSKAGPLTGNLEESAREARRALYRAFLDAGKLDRIALGHTKNDQAETILFRLLRGAGPAGLGAMRPATGEGLVRPLLDTSRREVEEFLVSRDLAWREDSTNRSLDFARNRIRHELLPQLAADWNPRIVDGLALTAQLLQDDSDYWEAEIRSLADRYFRVEGDKVILDGIALAKAHPAVSRRIIRHAASLVRGDLKALDYARIEAILRLATQTEGDGRLQAPGLDVFRSFGQIRISKPVADGLTGRNWRFPLQLPGVTPIPGGPSKVSTLLAEGTGYTEREGDLDADCLAAPLELRNWRPGDQYLRRGRSHLEKVKTLFQEWRIPLWERRNWPVIVMSDEIVWVKLFGTAAKFAASARSRRIVSISILGPN
jgi:tRNA(Ile)-lysidine synthase